VSGRQASPLSSRARELLARERGVTEDEVLKARAFDRARLALEAGRPSSVGLRIRGPWLAAAGSRHRWRALLVIAAAIGAAGLAAAQLGALVMRADRTDPAPAVIPTAPVETNAVHSAPPSPRLAPSVSVPERLPAPR